MGNEGQECPQPQNRVIIVPPSMRLKLCLAHKERHVSASHADGNGNDDNDNGKVDNSHLDQLA